MRKGVSVHASGYWFLYVRASTGRHGKGISRTELILVVLHTAW